MKGKMMQKEQPEALRLADQLEKMPGYDFNKNYCEAAAELRRLHDVEMELQALRAQIGQGVPVKADFDQLQAMQAEWHAVSQDDCITSEAKFQRVYKAAMLASAQPAPQQIWQGVPDGVLDVLDNFEKKERSPLQAYLVAGLVNELRTALLTSAHPASLTDEREIAACGLMPLIEDYATSVRNGDKNSSMVLKKTIEASLEELESQWHQKE